MKKYDNRYNFYKFFSNTDFIFLAPEKYKVFFEDSKNSNIIFYKKNLLKYISKYKNHNSKKNLAIISKERNFVTEKAKEYLIIPSIFNPKWILQYQDKVIVNPSTFIKPSKLFSAFIWKVALILNRFKMINLLFKEKLTVIYHEDSENYFDQNFKKIYKNYKNFSLYTGAYGPYQKFTFQIFNKKDQIIGYSKIGTDSITNLRIENEITFLKKLNSLDFKKLIVPKLLGKFELDELSIICQSNDSKKAIKSSIRYMDLHNDVLVELFNKTKIKINCQTYISQNRKNFKKLLSYETNEKKYVNFEKAFKLLEKYLTNKYMYIAISHGDFNSWNILKNKNRLYIYDWELAEYRGPLWDFFHFILFYNLRFSSKSNSEIINVLTSHNELKTLTENYLSKINDKGSKDIYLLFFAIQLFIIYNDYDYLSNKKMHEQNKVVDNINLICIGIVDKLINKLVKIN